MAEKYGHSDQAFGHEAFNLKDPAFEKGLEHAGHFFPEQANGEMSKENLDYPNGGKAGQNVYPSAEQAQTKKRFPTPNDPVGFKNTRPPGRK